MSKPLQFTVEARSGGARAGRIKTAHSEIETPVFMPVGTAGAVKAVTVEQLREIDARIILGNTYHLYLRPGLEVLEAGGGLHGLMGWDRSLLTDSGGFQVFSLKKLRKLSDEGVEFQSHIDGSKHLFTPEKVVEIQRTIGSDIMMCLDVCPALPAERETIEEAMRRTTLWAERSLRVERKSHQAIFGIVQGGLDYDLRMRHLETLSAMPFHGLALGGLSVGESHEEMVKTVRAVAPHMPEERPRYLMGVGTPLDLVEAVAAGVDMFDCVLPTRNARMGTLYCSSGRINIKRAENRHDMEALPETHPSLAHLSRAYLRHLFTAKEITGLTLLTLHNLHYFLRLMERMREAIREDRFEAFRTSFLEGYTH